MAFRRRWAAVETRFRGKTVTQLVQWEAVIADAERAIEAQLKRYRAAGRSMLATSSFQTQSVPLLHLLSRFDRTIPVYFINTGYHFPETIAFRDQITQQFGLNLVDLKPLTPKNLQRDHHGVLYYASDPDQCCFMNKIQPLQPVLAERDVWISGIRSDQNKNRSRMGVEERTPEGALRYHPMLRWSARLVHRYIRLHDLPTHPLDEQGYDSIGCEPCTRRMVPGDGREGRWFGMNKTECGLHTDLVEK